MDMKALKLQLLELTRGDVTAARDALAFIQEDSTTAPKASSKGSTKTVAKEQPEEEPASEKTEPEPTTTEAVDAGTGKPLDEEPTGNVQPEGEQKPLTLTPQSVKTMAAKLTMMDGGSEKLATILKSYGAAKFSEVPADKLADFAGDLIDAGAPTE